MRDYVGRLLGPLYDVEAVPDGESALAAVRRCPPDLVLADVMMPRLDGFGLLQALRADERARSIPVILLSARAGEESRVEGMQAGADDYLVKPFSARELLARVDAHVRKARERQAAAVRRSEERLRRMVDVDGVGALVFALPDGRLVDANDYFLRMFGYTREELAAAPLTWRDMTPPEYLAESERQMEGLAAIGRIGPYEKEYLRKDGSRMWMAFAGVALGDGTVVEYCIDVSDRKRAETALQEAMAARTELLRRLVTAQEDERRRVARDLHDTLGQELTALILGLDALERAVPEGAPGRARLREVQATVERIGREAYDLALELRPTALDDLGLSAALAAYVARWSGRTGIAAAFEPVGLDGGRLPPEVETTVYRVVQEALNNVARHAGATRVGILAARHEGEFIALVEDDGRGFDPEAADARPGRQRLGLLGMRERVGLVGGRLSVQSGEGEGTIVRARIPLTRAPGEATHDG
jgi:PAS domain S-box-containing protein